MSNYICDTCNKLRESSIQPPVASKSGKGNVCPSCNPEYKYPEEGRLEELRLQASEPQLNGLGEE